MDITRGISASLDHNIVSLLASKTTQALLRVIPASELVLICSALTAISHAVPSKMQVMGRVSSLMTQILFSVALSTSLQWIADTQDTPLAATALLAVFFWGGALDPDGQLSVTSQYLLVDTLTSKFKGDNTLLMASWAVAFAPHRLVPQDAACLAQLVTTETLSTGLMQWMPRTTLLAATVVLLHLCAPFIPEFPALSRIYRFAVFALSNDQSVAAVPAWIVAAALWAVWSLENDPVIKRMTSVAGTSFAVLTCLDALRFATDNDPVPTLLALIFTVRILQEDEPTPKIRGAN